jgi:hypothetical protein
MIIIPVVESKEVRDAMKKVEDGDVGKVKGVILFKEVNDSKCKDIDLGGLEKQGKKVIVVGSENWRVQREEKMEVKYWVMVWLMPALLLGIALQ